MTHKKKKKKKKKKIEEQFYYFFYKMINYDILDLDYDTKEITFFFDDDINKKIKICVLNEFDEYIIAKGLDYYVDLNNGDLVRIPGGSLNGSLRKPTFGWINMNQQFFRPALQSEVDYDDLIKYKGDNGRLYSYLEEKYKEL